MEAFSDVSPEAVGVIADEVRNALLAMPNEPVEGLKAAYPAMWCEWASIALALTLESRGFGAWTFVAAGQDESKSTSGHAWLELRDGAGQRRLTADMTLHQFAEWREPYFGTEISPARAHFPITRYAGPWTEWPVLGYKPIYNDYADAVREFLRLT